MRKTFTCLILVGYFFWAIHEDALVGKERGGLATHAECDEARGFYNSGVTSECYGMEVDADYEFDLPGYYAP
jgi:hypothetical protein